MSRLVFLGTPQAAVPPLQALVSAGHDIALVVTQPDKRRSRGGAATPSPVKQAALGLGLPVGHKVRDVVHVDAELGIVVAFGRLIKPEILERLAFVNVHFSLLPRWRGAAPVERAILAGDAQTGICLMRLEETLDTGPVYARETVTIGPTETAAELRDRLSLLGAQLLVSRLDSGVSGLGEPEPQQGEPTFAAKIDVAELWLDWTQPAVQLQRVVRIGRAWTTLRGRRLLVHAAAVTVTELGPAAGPSQPGMFLTGTTVATADGILELLEVQPEGKPRQPAISWANGARIQPGERLDV